MPDLLRYYGFKLNKHNRMPCPIHNGKDDNLRVKEHCYTCFVCGSKGDVIKFVQEYFGLSFDEAIKKINEDFSLGLPIGEKMDSRKKMALARDAFERRKVQNEKEARLKKLETEFWSAFDEYARLDKQMMEYRPKSKTEPLHPLFVEAINGIERAKYRLGRAQEELYQYEQRNN